MKSTNSDSNCNCWVPFRSFFPPKTYIKSVFICVTKAISLLVAFRLSKDCKAIHNAIWISMPWILTSTNCSLSDATTDALFIHPHAATEGYAALWQDQLSGPARAGRSGAPITPIALSQWPANEQLRNRIREKEEGKKQEDILPGLRLGCYSAFLNSAPRGFELVFGCHLWPTLVVQS